MLNFLDMPFFYDEDGAGGGATPDENTGEGQFAEIAKTVSELAAAVEALQKGFDGFRKSVNAELKDRRLEVKRLSEAISAFARDGEEDGDDGDNDGKGGANSELAQKLAELEAENKRLRALRAVESAARAYGFADPADAATLLLNLSPDVIEQTDDEEALTKALDTLAQKYPAMTDKQRKNDGGGGDNESDNDGGGASRVEDLLSRIIP